MSNSWKRNKIKGGKVKMLKRLLVCLGLLLVVGYTFAEGTPTYVHFGGAAMRVSGHTGINNFVQANGSLRPSVEGENLAYTDWQCRSYGLVGINSNKDFIVGIGYYIGRVGRVGIQVTDYYEQDTDKDYFCAGLYADGSIIRGLWQKFISFGNFWAESTK